MEDDFLEIYERVAEGDMDGARRRLARLRQAGVDPERIREMQAFLDAPEDGAPTVAQGAPSDVTHPARGLAGRATRDAVPFQCLACGHDEHIVRPVVLNRRMTALFGLDLVDRSAVTYACTHCGHIAWFGRSAPGFAQAWADHDAGRLGQEGPGGGTCRMCRFQGLEPSRALRNTRFLTFLGMPWAYRGARVERCIRCGLLHWSGTDAEGSPWTGQGDTGEGCAACGGRRLDAHPALHHPRAATLLGLDWLDQAAWVVHCVDCRAMTWWTRRPQSTE